MTPRLALRVGAARLRSCSSSSPRSSCASGRCRSSRARSTSTRRSANSFRAVPRAGAARARSSTATAVRSSTNARGDGDRSSGRPTCRRSTRALRRAEAARAASTRVPLLRDRARDQARRTRRPADAGDRPRRPRASADGRLSRRARGRVPRRHDGPRVRAPLPVPGRSPRRCSATSARSRQRSSSRSATAYGLNDEIGQAGVESAYDSYLRGVDGDAAAARRLARPPAQRACSTTALPKPGNTVRLTLDAEAAAGRREGARVRHPASRRANGAVGGARRRDRRARPERRLDPRDGVVADLQAVGVRGPRDDEGARRAGPDARRRRRRRTTRRSTARCRRRIRRARCSSR